MVEYLVVLDDHRRVISHWGVDPHDDDVTELILTGGAVQELKALLLEVLHEQVASHIPPPVRVGIVPQFDAEHDVVEGTDGRVTVLPALIELFAEEVRIVRDHRTTKGYSGGL